MKNGAPLVDSYAGRLGEARVGRNNFSFKADEDLDLRQAGALFAEAGEIFSASPVGVRRGKRG